MKVQTYLVLMCLTSFQASRNVDLVLLGIFTMLLSVAIVFPTLPDAPWHCPSIPQSLPGAFIIRLPIAPKKKFSKSLTIF